MLLMVSCNKESQQGNNPPQITFLSITPSEFKNGSQDTIKVNFKIYAKDGDIGSTGAPSEPANIFFYQSYAEGTSGEALLPYIPDGFQQPGKPVEGVAMIAIPANFYPLDSAHIATGDTFHYEIKIKDRAGNFSNTITTPDIYITP